MREELLEQACFDACADAIASSVTSHPDEVIYAAAFHMFYSDYTVVLAPAFALNCTSAIVREECDGEAFNSRWQCPDWRWPVTDSVYEAMAPYYAEVSEALDGASDDAWERRVAELDALVGRVCMRLTAAARAGSGPFEGITVPAQFIVVAIDWQRGEEAFVPLLRASVAPEHLDVVAEVLQLADGR